MSQIKPRKPKLEAEGRGLATWPWLRRYLQPALHYLGVYGDFETLVSGGSQPLITEPAAEEPTLSSYYRISPSVGGGWTVPVPTLWVRGSGYSPTYAGGTDYTGISGVGMLCIVWEGALDTQTDGSVYRWDLGGSFNMTVPPYLDFNTTPITAQVDPSSGSVTDGRFAIPLASFTATGPQRLWMQSLDLFTQPYGAAFTIAN